MEPLGTGTKAPDFTLPSTPDQKLSLHERGRRVMLADGADGIPSALESMQGVAHA